jgi:hypothetical protein
MCKFENITIEHMKKMIFCLFLAFSVLSCSFSNNANSGFSTKDFNEISLNIVKIISQKPANATKFTRFDESFEKHYLEISKKYSLEKIQITQDSTYAFFMTRPVGNLSEFKRGVIGKFKLKKGSNMPLEFEEIVNTPHLKAFEVKERGSFLFSQYIKNKHLNNFLAMKHYIEWPDSTLVYDKSSQEWVRPNKSN